MKRFFCLFLILLLLAACGSKDNVSIISETETSVSEVINQTASEEKSELVSAEDTDAEMNKFVFSTVSNTEAASYHALLEAIDSDGSIAWSYESEEIFVGQLANLEDLGYHGNGYYLNVDGKIVKISVEGDNAGKVEWTNEDYQGASSSRLFTEDANGNTLLYIGGYYGPDFMIIDDKGNTLERINAIELREVDNRGAFFWLSSMTFNGNNIDFFYDSNAATVTFNPKTLSVVDVVYCDSVTIKGENEYRISPLGRDWSSDENSVLEWRIETVGSINQEIVTSVDIDSTYFPSDADEILAEADFNCDGLMDLLIYGGSLGNHGDRHYYYFINNGSEYIECEGFYDISEPIWDEEKGLISSLVRDSAASYFVNYYKIENSKIVCEKEEHYVYSEQYEDYVLQN